ncbi:MAG: M12 family metallopeptidase [Actinomycetota bacterium]
MTVLTQPGFRLLFGVIGAAAAMIAALFFVAGGLVEADDQYPTVDPNAPQMAMAEVRGTGEQVAYDVIDGMAVTDGDILLGTHADVQRQGISPLVLTTEPACPVGLQCGVIDTDPRRAWPGGVIPYVIPAGTSSNAVTNINNAIAHWESRTSLDFVQRSTQPDYVVFNHTGNGFTCSSYLGRIGGPQPINYAGSGLGCLVHEIGHAVGLAHEHNRNDRDNYINIDFTNVSGNAASQFRKATYATDVGTYDLGSVMHYGPYSFALDRSRPVITPRDPNVPLSAVGGNGLLTDSDVQAVEYVYRGTPPPPPTTTTTTAPPTTTTTAPPTTTTTTAPPTTTTTTAPPTTTTTTAPPTTTTTAPPTTTTTTAPPTTTTTAPPTTTTTTAPTTTTTAPPTTTTTTAPTTTTTTAPTTTTTTAPPTTTTAPPTTTTTAPKPPTTRPKPTTSTTGPTRPPTTYPPTTVGPPTTSGPTTSTPATTEPAPTTTSIAPPTTKPVPTTPPRPGVDRRPTVVFQTLTDGGTIPRRVPYGGIRIGAYDPDAGNRDGDGIRWVTLVLRDGETGRFLGARREYWSTNDWGVRLRSGRTNTLTAYAVSDRSAGGGWSKTSITVTAE